MRARDIWYDMIRYDIFVNCNWVAPGGGSTLHVHTHKQYTEQHSDAEYTEYYVHKHKNT
jgi:hypothetical protein